MTSEQFTSRAMHAGRMIICVCAGGFVYPNTFIENVKRVRPIENDQVGESIKAKT